jgi:transcriptional regulator with XRE-family HTH domain
VVVAKLPKPVDSHDRQVGQRVRMYRIKAGMSQHVLGKQLGVTFQQIQKYEKGTNRIRTNRLHQISEVLGVPVASLLEDSPVAKLHDVDQVMNEFLQFLETSLGQRLVQGFIRIRDKKVRTNLTALIENISDKTSTTPSRSKKKLN